MRNIRNKNAPPLAGLVQEFIDSAYDTVKLVADNLPAIIKIGDEIDNGTFENIVYLEDIDTFVELNAIVQDEELATEDYVDQAVTGLYEFMGGYDANTNTPDLTTSPNAFEVAQSWQVTVAGTFFSVNVEPGDQITAVIDSPALEGDWSIVNRNIDSAAFATAEQGAKADTALQPADNISELTNDSGFTDDQTDAEIETGYNNQVPVVSKAGAELGTSTTVQRWTPERVKEAVVALSPPSGVEEAPEDGTGYVRKDAGWVAETVGGGTAYDPGMMTFDGSLGSYESASTTHSGNLITVVARFKMDELTGGGYISLFRFNTTNDRVRGLISDSDNATVENRGVLRMRTINSSGVTICQLKSDIRVDDSVVHTLFYAFDGDNGTAQFYIDGVDADDLTYTARVAPTTGTLDTSSSSNYVGKGIAGTDTLDGDLGYCGMDESYLTNPTDFYHPTNGLQELDEVTWTEWGSQPLYWNQYGTMTDNKGTAGNMTKVETVTGPAGGTEPSTGGGMAFSHETTNQTLTADQGILSEAGLTHTLPATPSADDKCSVWDVSDNAHNNAITIDGNGEQIENGAGSLDTDISINMAGGRFDFVYNGTYWKYSYVVQTIQPNNVITRTIRKEFRAEDFYPYSCTAVTASANATGIKALAFGDTAYTVGLSVTTLPKEWVQGSRMRTRLVWNPTSTSTGNAYFLTQFSLVPNGDTWDGDPDVTQSCVNNENAGGVADDTQITPWSAWGDGLTGDVDDVLYVKLMRAGATDTLTGNAEVRLIEIEFEYEETLTAAVTNNPNTVSRTMTGTTDTLLASDAGKAIYASNAAAQVLTIPDGLPDGFQFILAWEGVGAPTVAMGGTETKVGVDGPPAQYGKAHFEKRGTVWWGT